MSYLLLLPIVLPLLGGIGIFFLSSRRVSHVVLYTTLILTMAACMVVYVNQPSPLQLFDIGSFTLRLSFDSLSHLFLPLITLIWPLAGWYSGAYMKHVDHENQFYGFFLLSESALIALSLSANILTFYLNYELLTLFSAPMVLHSREREAISAAVKYLGYSVGGAAMALAGIFFLSSWGVGDFVPGGVAALHQIDPALTLPVYLLMVLGFGCKAGIWPLHSWLPTAHPMAPAPASAMLSGLISKIGILGVMRVSYYLYPPDMLRGTWAQKTLMVLALFTVFMGSVLAFREPLLKKRLAYSTVSQASYVLFGLFLYTPLGMMGAMMQMMYHALAKSGLFLTSGSFIYSTGLNRVKQLRGVGRVMPITLLGFALAALSLVGIPPFGGFVSKWFLAAAALESGPQGVLICVVMLLSALLTAGYLFPIVVRGFFPGPETQPPACPGDPALSMSAPVLVLGALCLLLGMFPTPLRRLVVFISSAVF